MTVYLNLSGVVTTSVPPTAMQRRMTALTTTRVPDGDFCKKPTLSLVLPSCLRSRPDNPSPLHRGRTT